GASTMKTVDIVIDNYNYARFLRGAIESALAQTHPATRVIVVDDGSTDESRAIVEQYGERVLAVFNDHGGQASAFNTGFMKGSGDVVMFLDADDELLPDTAARVVDALDHDPRRVKLQFRLEVIDESGRRTGERKPPDHVPMPDGDVREQCLAHPFDMAWLPTSGMAFPRATLQRVFPLAEGADVGADWTLQYVVPLFGPVRSEPWIGGRYRVHGANRYERGGTLDLEHLRHVVALAGTTRVELRRVAAELGLEAGDLLSVSDAANRLILRRLDRARSNESVWSLVSMGWRAASRRRDVSPLLRAAFRAWFVLMAIAPAPACKWLAAQFVAPQRRAGLNSLIKLLHQRRVS
ncbi:MAG TPA: glycosyltransferase family 2 protein, partial [Acidimicrobiia bacterium]|nr:glycosyltransferase family 2 protein [Acidimicrobiia bacterium]